MRVLFFLTSLGAGGTEASTAALLPALRERGIDCSVAVLKHTGVGFEAQVRENGFRVRKVAGSSLPAQIRSLRALLRAERPDVLHTAIFDADLVGRLGAWRSGVPVVSSLVNTSYDPARLDDLAVPRWKLRIAQAADAATARYLTAALHAVSEGVAKANRAHLHLADHEVVVIERGRDAALLPLRTEEHRALARSRFAVRPNDFMLVCVGRVEFQKGHEHIIRAMPIIRERCPTARLFIAGRAGNASREVQTAIVDSGVGEIVELLGHRDDIAELLAAADVFVLPSMYEGTAGAALEAMAVGVPIVSSCLVGLEGVLENGRNAVLVPRASPEALANGVSDLLGDVGRRSRLASRARHDFEETFDIERSADRMAEFYRTVVSGVR